MATEDKFKVGDLVRMEIDKSVVGVVISKTSFSTYTVYWYKTQYLNPFIFEFWIRKIDLNEA